ncbi:MAG: hypothetical protein U9R42_12340 [Bacteroidota bacterium]|nr:hypothetical protein [Bacteroidota bacterium]
MNLLEKNDQITTLKKEKSMFWNDFLIQEYYNDYFQNITSSELDYEFNHKLKILVKTLNKLNKKEKEVMIDLLSNLINFYIENKVNKELEHSLRGIFKFL